MLTTVPQRNPTHPESVSFRYEENNHRIKEWFVLEGTLKIL